MTGPTRLVARREVIETLRTRSVRVGWALFLVVVVAAIVVPSRVQGGPPRPLRLGVVGQLHPLAQQTIVATTGRHVDVVTVDDDGARRGLREGTLDAVIVGRDRVLVERTLTDALAGVTRLAIASMETLRTLNALEAQGLTDAQIGAFLATEPPVLEALRSETAVPTRRLLVAPILMFVVFVLIQIYAAWIIHSVLEEKQSRVVEIVLPTMRPTQLLTGKLIGMAAVAGIQVASVATAALVTLAVIDEASLRGVRPSEIGLALLWFVLGFMLYQVMNASLGALVSRSQEVGMSTILIVLPLVFAFVVGGMAVTAAPTVSTLTRVTSLVPFTAPIVMLGRMITGTAAVGEVLVAIALIVVTTVGITLLGARLYERGIVHPGGLSLRRALRLAA